MREAETGYRLMGELLPDVVFYGLLAAAAAAVLTGAALLFAPERFTVAAERWGSWRSTRKYLRWLELPRRTESWFYRHHHGIGVLVALGAAGVLYAFLHDPGSVGDFAFGLPAGLDGVANTAIRAFLVGGNAVALVAGVVIAVRPSVLKGLEGTANTWVSTRQMGQRLDVQHRHFDRLVINRPRLFGLMLIAAGAYVGISAVAVRIGLNFLMQ